MKRLMLLIVSSIVFFSITFAGNNKPIKKVNWNKVLSKLSDYRFTGQSGQLPLGYSYDALEPVIDAKTVEVHYSKHHAAYTKNLNDATANTDYKSVVVERSILP